MDRNQLLGVIEKLKPAISNKSILDQASLMLFNKEYITSYNSHIAISIPFESEIIGGVPFDEMLALLKKIKAVNIDIGITDDYLGITSGKTNAILNIVKNVDFPDLEKENEEWKPVPSDFVYGVSICATFTSKNIMDGVLEYINVNNEKVSACDSVRATRYVIQDSMPEMNILYSFVPILIKQNPQLYRISKNWIHFKDSEENIYSCRKYIAPFPTIEYLPEIQAEKKINVVFPSEIKEIIDRVGILGYKNQKGEVLFNLTISKDKIICSGDNDKGRIEESIDVDFPEIENDITVVLGCAKMQDILLYSNKMTYVPDMDKIFFYDDKLDHILMVCEIS